MSENTIHSSRRADRDLARSTKALGVSSEADDVRRALTLPRYGPEARKGGGRLVVENNRGETKRELIPI